MPWRLRAACRGAAPDVFFPPFGSVPSRDTRSAETGVRRPSPATGPTDRGTTEPDPVDPAAAARAVCRRCPVIEDCRAFAMAIEADEGVWAGLDPRQLAELARVPPRPGTTRLRSEHPTRTTGTDLTVSVSTPHPDVTVLRVHGEIDMVTAPHFARALADAHHDLDAALADRNHGLRDLSKARVVCDLTGVRLLAASGLAVLAEAVERSRGHAVALWLVADSRPVLRFLELARLDRAVPVERHLTDAVTLPHR